jgi:predicted ATPase/DNA-binding XRE family transcriptional regulator
MGKKLSEEISFGQWIRQRRRLLDLTQQALADQVGCARITLRRIESGALKPSKELAVILLEKLGAPRDVGEQWLHFARGLSGIPHETTPQLIPIPRSTNLPNLLTSFVGREKELADIHKFLQDTHMLTLMGPGGIGKTRLSIRVAQEVLDNYPDGVWLVELAPILDPLLVPRTTAITIGLRDEPQRPVIDMLCDYLRQKKILIILDNCEHLIDACAHMSEKILHAAPNVRILASSREAFGIAGEVVYQVPSLGLPDIEQLPSIASLSQYEAVKLFIDRATAAVQNFTVTNENAPALAQLCHHLDGIPLAIELAAAKVRVLSLEQINKRLDDRFRLLTGGSRTALPRHQTLRAAIDWSYDLLSPAEQTLFQRLSVFVDGWTLEAAESVCSDANIKSEDILDLLAQLIHKSLVHTEELQGQTHYRMLETIRQYANEKLGDSGESNLLRDNHLDYFLHLAEAAAPYLIRPEQLEWLARLDANYENLRAALEWALIKESTEPSLRLCAALARFWIIRCNWMEGSKWLESALGRFTQNPSSLEKTARVKALYHDAELADQLDEIERLKTSAELSLTLAEQNPDKRDIAIARFFVGYAFSRYENYGKGYPLIKQSLAEFRELNDPYWELKSFMWLGDILVNHGELKHSERITQNLALARKAGEKLNLAQALSDYSYRLYTLNRINDAKKYAEEADILLKQIGSRVSLSSMLFAEIAWLEGNYKEAKSYYVELYERFGLIGEKNQRSAMIASLGLLALEQGDLDQAQANFEEGLATAREIDNEVFIARRLPELGNVYYQQGNIEKFKQSFIEGLSLAKELGRYQKTYPLISILNAIYFQKPETSARLLGTIDNFQKEYDRPIGPFLNRYCIRAEADAREALGDAVFDSAFAEGQKLSLDEALDIALKTVEEM